MTNRRLLELYGFRYTPFARMAGAIAVFVAGMLIAGNCAPDDFLKRTPDTQETE